MTRQRRRKLNPLVIASTEVVSEVRVRSPDLVRLTRVRYEGNDYTFVDVRMFSRGYDENGNEIFHPTGKGIQVKEDDFLSLLGPYLETVGRPQDRRPVH